MFGAGPLFTAAFESEDRIRELEAQVERLKGALEKAQEHLSRAGYVVAEALEKP